MRLFVVALLAVLLGGCMPATKAFVPPPVPSPSGGLLDITVAVVQDYDGAPIPGVFVSALPVAPPSGPQQAYSAVTYVSGTAVLRLPPGDWKIKAVISGFGTGESTLSTSSSHPPTALRIPLRLCPIGHGSGIPGCSGGYLTTRETVSSSPPPDASLKAVPSPTPTPIY
ncbi:carboxypeptidase regulatory-like domain-containing protein [bacterium]|nr:carboxypeptidase regulatory-like domain-containing protein [bacterium]